MINFTSYHGNLKWESYIFDILASGFHCQRDITDKCVIAQVKADCFTKLLLCMCRSISVWGRYKMLLRTPISRSFYIHPELEFHPYCAASEPGEQPL